MNNAGGPLLVSEVIAGLSAALDLADRRPVGHSARSCAIGMLIAKEIALPRADQSDLFYALLMKNAGCTADHSDSLRALPQAAEPFRRRVRSVLSAAINGKRFGRLRAEVRSGRAALMARRCGLSENTAAAIQSLHHDWKGTCGPGKDSIPLLSRIMSIAQAVETAHREGGRIAAVKVVKAGSGRRFDPSLVRAFLSVAARQEVWSDYRDRSRVLSLQPKEYESVADDVTVDNICLAFADITDARSLFTYRHSIRVAGIAASFATRMGLGENDAVILRRAALLHDIGMLSITGAVMDRPGRMTDEEWTAMKRHPYFSQQLLNRIPGFGKVAELAASHHERLDGTGYYRNLTAKDLSMSARVLAVADVFEALSSTRAWRDAMPLEEVFAVMRKYAPESLDADCIEALRSSHEVQYMVA